MEWDAILHVHMVSSRSLSPISALTPPPFPLSICQCQAHPSALALGADATHFAHFVPPFAPFPTIWTFKGETLETQKARRGSHWARAENPTPDVATQHRCRRRATYLLTTTRSPPPPLLPMTGPS